MKNVAIISGANSELAKPYINHFVEQGGEVIALYKHTPISPADHITPLRIDLQDTIQTRDALWQLFDEKNLVEYAKIYFLHLTGGFRYEGLTPNKNIEKKTHDSNVLTFENVYQSLFVYLDLKNRFDDKEVTLFNIGSITDSKEGDTPWFAYSSAKNKLRGMMRHEAEKYNNVNALFINAGTIDISKERALRPYADQQYRLSREKLFEATIKPLLTTRGYKEQEVYKKHPDYERIFTNEHLADTHTRWQKEMGEISALPIVYSKGQQEKSLTGLLRHHYVNHSGYIGLLYSAYWDFVDGKKAEAIANIEECMRSNRSLRPKHLLAVSIRDKVLSNKNLQLFGDAIEELEAYYDEYMNFKEEEMRKLLELNKEGKLTAEMIDDIKPEIDKKFGKIIGYFENNDK